MRILTAATAGRLPRVICAGRWPDPADENCPQFLHARLRPFFFRLPAKYLAFLWPFRAMQMSRKSFDLVKSGMITGKTSASLARRGTCG